MKMLRQLNTFSSDSHELEIGERVRKMFHFVTFDSNPLVLFEKLRH